MPNPELPPSLMEEPQDWLTELMHRNADLADDMKRSHLGTDRPPSGEIPEGDIYGMTQMDPITAEEWEAMKRGEIDG